MEPCITAGTGIEETGFGYTMSLVSGKYKMIILYWLVEYSLSVRGRSLIPILDAMCIWGEENRPRGKGA